MFDDAVAALKAGPDMDNDDAFNAWQQRTAPAGYAAWGAVEQAHAHSGRWSLAAARAYFSVDHRRTSPAFRQAIDAFLEDCRPPALRR